MVRPAKNIVDVNMDILRSVRGPISNQQMMTLAEDIYGDDWNTSKRINLQCIRTALRTLEIVTHPKYGFWGIAPDADAKLAALGNPDSGDIWNEHMRIKHGR